MLEKIHADANFSDLIIWSDEASFNLSGTVNRRNSIFWALENPHRKLVKKMKSQSICVLAGISSLGVFGPFFFPNTVTGASFLKVMQEEMMPEIAAKHDLETCWFQLDGAPGHWAKAVRDWLN